MDDRKVVNIQDDLKVVDIHFDNLLRVASGNTYDRDDSESPELPQLEKEQLVYKIKSCLEFLEKLNEQPSDTSELSGRQALVFIYFVETFALQGSGNEKMNDELADYLAPNYTKEIDRKMFRRVREALLKRSDRRLEPKDVHEYMMKGHDIHDFFKELQKYTQHVLTGIDKVDTRSTNNVHAGSAVRTLDQLIVIPEAKLGNEITDVKSFLATEFEELLKKAFRNDNWTSEDLFYFIVNFFPIFREKSEWDCKKLRDLRNRLLHQFHKYGCVQFGNEIVGIRHELLKYHYAKEVYKIVHKIEQDNKHDNEADKIDEELNKIFESPLVKDIREVRRDVTQPAAKKEAGGFQGYQFSQSMLPEKVTNFKELAYQYFKFKFLTHHFIEKNDEDEEEVEVKEKEGQKTKITVKGSHSRKKLIDSDRREMFEEFDKLERLRTEKNKEYPDKKKRLKQSLVADYGIKENHFNKTFKYFEEHDGKIGLKSGSTEAESVAKILTTLKEILGWDKLERLRTENNKEYPDKKRFEESLVADYGIKENHFDETFKYFEENDGEIGLKSGSTEAESVAKILKTLKERLGRDLKLSNQDIISLYDRFVTRPVNSDPPEGQNLLENVANDPVDSIVAEIELPKDQRIKLYTDYDKALFVPIKEVIRDMLNIFCNAYNTYRVEFEIKDIFNDDTILDYMTRNETEEVDVVKLVEPYFKLIRRLRIDEELTEDEKKNVEDVQFVISGLKEKLKLSYSAIASLYEKLMNSEIFFACKNKKEFIGERTRDEKKFAKTIVEIFDKRKLSDKEKLLRYNERSDMVSKKNRKLSENKNNSERTEIPKETYKEEEFQKLKSVGEKIGKIAGDVLETFKDKLQLKNHNEMIIKKLMNLDYAAPYIVRLLKKVESDEQITNNGLKMLIKFLLNGQDSSYIKHLNDLLYINSSKLDLYEEVCTQMLQAGFNVKDMHFIFNEPKHVDGILSALVDRIDSDNAKDEFTKKVLESLNSVVLELILFNQDDTASEILDGKLKKTFERLRNENKMKSDDPIFVDYQSNLVKVRNAQGKRKKKSELHREALEILEKVHVNVDKSNYSNYSQYLLVLCHKAYTLKLLRMNKESHQAYNDLFVKIVKFALRKDVSDRIITAKTYREIEESPDYCKLRDASEVSQRYLDILDIGHNIAFTLLCQAVTEQADRDTDVKNCEDALEMYNELYRRTEMKFVLEHQDTVQIMRQLAAAHSRTCRAILKHLNYSPNPVEDCQKALQHLRDALKQKNEILKSQLEKDNNYHIPVKDLLTYFAMKDIHCIAIIYNELGDMLPQHNPEKGSHYQIALDVNEKIYDFQKLMNSTKEDQSTFKILKDIGYTYAKLGSCKLPTHKQRVLYYKKALEKYDDAHEIAKKIFPLENSSRFESLVKVIYTHSNLHSTITDVALEHHSRELLEQYEDLIVKMIDKIKPLREDMRLFREKKR